MRKFKIGFGLVYVIFSIALVLALGEYDEINSNVKNKRSIFTQSNIFSKNKAPMHKALFTQRGYIQFLRWELPVPEIEEFTFCLWVKSTNLTYSHSIFSYSKNEEQRLARSWISPFGRSIHLEIGETEIMAHPTNIGENIWYHVCLSWENEIGHYGLWINGRKEVEGFATELLGHVIPSKGDIVVGQEYTDFDKGFEEGIEGAVFGFNLLLSSAFDKVPNLYQPIKQSGSNFPSVLSLGENNRVPVGFGSKNGIQIPSNFDLGHEIHRGIQLRRNGEETGQQFTRNSWNQGSKIFNENKEGMFDSTLKEYLGEEGIFDDRNIRRGGSTNGQRVIAVKFSHRTKRDNNKKINTEIIRNRRREIEPLGLQLVNLGYNHCEIGRGSPFIGGSKMLISWTRTPVKVFGGAIIKNAKDTCGHFG